MIKKTDKTSSSFSAIVENKSQEKAHSSKQPGDLQENPHHKDNDSDSLELYESASSGDLKGKPRPKLTEVAAESSQKKKSRTPSKTHPRQRGINLGSLYESSGAIGKLREESLKTSQPESITPEQRNDDLRLWRSAASSPKRQLEDPTLVVPSKHYVSAKNEKKIVPTFSQRPGPETRRNAINLAAEARAMQKHGTYRKLRLGPEDFLELKNTLISKLEVTDDVADDLVRNTLWSGGYPRPGRSEEDRSKDAKLHRREVFWNPKTVVRFLKKGLRGFGDRLFNPEGKTIEHIPPSGQGIRTSDLNVEHVALSASHYGHDVNLGPDLQTHRGVTNPPYFSKEAFEAEEARYNDDLKKDPKTPKPIVLVLMEKYDMKNKL